MHNVGIIGMGAIGRVVLENMRDHPRFSVVCAWDMNPEISQSVVQAFADVEICASPEALIADPRISVVYIATPPAAHGEYVRAAIEAGKMVYCEKPFGIDVDAGRKLAAEVEASGLASVINFNHGNAAATALLEAEMASGAMGEISGIDIFIHLSEWPREFQAHARWLAGRDQGGFTREMLSHWIYLSTRLMGQAKLIHAYVHYPDDTTASEIRVVAELTFGRTHAVINAAVGGTGPIGTEYTIWAKNKSYRLHSGGQVSSTDGGPWARELKDIADIGVEDHRRNLDAAAARFCGEEVKLPGIAEGFAVQQIVEQILSS